MATAKRSTKQRIMQLLNDEKHISYIYSVKDKDSGRRYIGKRTSTNRLHNNPLDDIGSFYFTSSQDTQFKESFSKHPYNYKIYVLDVSDDVEYINDRECNILTKLDAAASEKFFNRHTAGGQYSTTGKVPVIRVSDNHHMIISVEEYKEDQASKSPLYQSHHKNTARVIGKDGKGVRVSLDEYHTNKNDYRTHLTSSLWVKLKSSGEGMFVSSEEFKTNRHLYTKNTDGMVPAVDSDGNNMLISSDEYATGNYKSTHADMLTVTDIKTGSYIRIHKNDYNPSIHKSSSTGKVYVKSDNGVVHVSTEEYRRNKHKYELASSAGKKHFVYDMDANTWSSVDLQDIDSQKHLTKRTRLIHLYSNNELVDVFPSSSTYKRYKGHPILNGTKITKSYKSGNSFNIDGIEYHSESVKPTDDILLEYSSKWRFKDRHTH